jgi:hypothetical protein
MHIISIIQIAVINHGEQSLKHAHPQITSSFNMMLESIKISPKCIQYANEKLLCDKLFIKKATEYTGTSHYINKLKK